jgi:hypothetical protein
MPLTRRLGRGTSSQKRLEQEPLLSFAPLQQTSRVPGCNSKKGKLVCLGLSLLPTESCTLKAARPKNNCGSKACCFLPCSPWWHLLELTRLGKMSEHPMDFRSCYSCCNPFDQSWQALALDLFHDSSTSVSTFRLLPLCCISHSFSRWVALLRLLIEPFPSLSW